MLQETLASCHVVPQTWTDSPHTISSNSLNYNQSLVLVMCEPACIEVFQACFFDMRHKRLVSTRHRLRPPVLSFGLYWKSALEDIGRGGSKLLPRSRRRRLPLFHHCISLHRITFQMTVSVVLYAGQMQEQKFTPAARQNRPILPLSILCLCFSKYPECMQDDQYLWYRSRW